MKWSFKIATVAGTEVRIHITFFILLVFVAMQGMAGGHGLNGAFDALLFVSAAFICVLLHEFGHVFAASGYGIRTPDITLLPIGGVARGTDADEAGAGTRRRHLRAVGECGDCVGDLSVCWHRLRGES